MGAQMFLSIRERLLDALSRISRDRQSGQGMVEYALILVLIAVVVIVILTIVGHQVSNVFSNINKSLATG